MSEPRQISPEEYQARTGAGDTSPALDPLNDVEIVDGGRRVDVRYRKGGVEKVTIRQFSLRDCLAYDVIRTDIAKCVEFFCRKPEGWEGKVEPECALEIYDIGKAINQSFFDSVMSRVTPEIDHALASRGNLVRALGNISPALVALSPDSHSSPDNHLNGSQKTTP